MDLFKGADSVDRPRGQDAPPFEHGVVDTVDFEANGLLEVDRADLSVVRRAENDVIGQHLEVDRKGHRPPGRAEDDSPDTSPGQQLLALFLTDGNEVRIGRRVSPSVGTAMFSTEEIRYGQLECKRNPLESRRRRIGSGRVLEIFQVVGGHAGALGHLGDSEAEFVLTLGNTPAHISRIVAVISDLSHVYP